MFLNNCNPRRRLEPRVISVLEHHFQNRKSPCVEEMAFLAESLQLENKLVINWFKNRKQKERRQQMLFSHKTIPEVPFIGRMDEHIIRSSEMLSRQFNRIIRNPNLMDLYNSPLNLSNGPISRNVKRFTLGKPNGAIQRRIVLVLGTGGQIQQKFIDQIINYVVNVENEDNIRFLVEEEAGNQSNCISVYDIHHTEGFRIPFSLTIVVTPYSRDCEEQLFRDRNVAEMFREFIEAKDGIKELDMICNVTVETGEISKQPFLSIFGKDVEKNINSWKLSVDFLSDNKGPWQAVVQHFFTVLATMKPKSLSFTKMVLYERTRMEEVVDRLQPLMAAGSSKMEEMNKTKLTIAYCDYQLKIERELYFNYLSSTASASCYCTCSEPHCTMDPDNRSVINFTSGGEMCIKQEPSNSWCDNANHCRHQSYYGEESKLNDIRSKGEQLVQILQKDLLKNGNAIRHHLSYIWGCIHRFNKFALHGNSFSNKKVFDLLLDAGQHLKELNF